MCENWNYSLQSLFVLEYQSFVELSFNKYGWGMGNDEIDFCQDSGSGIIKFNLKMNQI